MLGILCDSTPNSVHESLGFAQAFTKESFESLSAKKDVNLLLYLTLVVPPPVQGGIFQGDSCKRNLVWARGNAGGKVIFILLKEIVRLQVSFTQINVRELSFQRPLT